MNKFLDIKWLTLLTLNGLMVLAISFKPPVISTTQIDLSHFDDRLDLIEKTITRPTPKPDLSAIDQHISKLNEYINALQNKDDHQLGELFSVNQIEVKKQLDGVAGLLKSLNEQKHPVKSLPATALPFQVLSIDSIQEVSVASVSYDYKTKALEQGDTLAGWKVIHVDFGKQYIEFENQDKEKVCFFITPNEVLHG